MIAHTLPRPGQLTTINEVDHKLQIAACSYRKLLSRLKYPSVCQAMEAVDALLDLRLALAAGKDPMAKLP